MLYRIASRVVVSSGSDVRERSSVGHVHSLPMFLTVDETADLLRTTSKAIYSMVDRGQIPGVTRIGKRLLFYRADVIRWLDESRASSLKE